MGKPLNTPRKRKQVQAWLTDGYGADWPIERVEREGQQWPHSFAASLLWAITHGYGWKVETHYEATPAGRTAKPVR